MIVRCLLGATLTVALAGPTLAGSVLVDDWPMFRADAHRSAFTPEELPAGLGTETTHPMDAIHDLSLKAARARFERDWIEQALARVNDNRTHAAKLLGISHRSLLYKIKEYGIGRADG